MPGSPPGIFLPCPFLFRSQPFSYHWALQVNGRPYSLFFISLLTAFWVILGGCAEKTPEQVQPNPVNERPDPQVFIPCGTPYLLNVRGIQPEVGVFEIMNDSSRLRLAFDHSRRYKMESIRVYLGKPEDLPRREDGRPDPAQFNIYSRGGNSNRDRWELLQPISQWPHCMKVSVQVELTDLESPEGEKDVVAWAMAGDEDSFTFDYCIQSCKKDQRCASSDAGDFTTYTPTGWVTEGQKLLESDFETVFPKGMELGCLKGYKLSRSKDVVELLQGKKSIGAFGNGPQKAESFETLARETGALVLSVEYDRALPDFSASPAPLDSLVVTEGAFTDWPVREVISEANTLLGGCASNYSPQQLTGALEAINSNFSNGTVSGGFLICPELEP